MSTATERLRLSEAARYLGVSRRWLYRRIWRGELPAVKIGGLYFIRKADLDGLLKAAPTRPGSGAPEAPPLKCAACWRLITTDSQIGELCQAEGCEGILCSACWSRGVRYCLHHQPDRETRWQEAMRAYRAGQYPLLVRSDQARFRERMLLERVRWRLSRIRALRHPRGDEVISITSWAEREHYTDQREHLMSLLGRVALDAEALNRYPVNPRLRYSFPPPRRGRRKSPLPLLAIEVVVLSRMEVMVRDGFDTRPLGVETLRPWVARAMEEVRQRGETRLMILAATTGWDAETQALVSGEAGEIPLVHEDLLLYFYDMETRQLFYTPWDTRLPLYHEIMDPLLPEERTTEIAQAIEQIMLPYDSLTLAEAMAQLPYSRAALRAAFEHLAAQGTYALVSVPPNQEWALIRS